MSTLISADQVTKTFGATRAVDDLTLSIGDGELIALLGPNGAGKTTLIRMIVGLIKPDSGTVSRSFSGERGKLGYLPEERGLYQDMPVLRTLTYFARLQGMPSRQATMAAGEWLERFGLAGRGQEKVKALSKGNQQKVQFAAAVLHKPRVAVLDEPFSGLDPVNQEVFLDLIRELRREGMTVIFSAHQMTLVERLADRVFLMRGGREVLSGTIPELRRQWQTGNRLVIGTSEAADISFLTTDESVESVESFADGEVRLLLKPDRSVSPLLRTIGEHLEVKYLRSEEVTLHEIYLRTVQDAGSSSAAEAAA